MLIIAELLVSELGLQPKQPGSIFVVLDRCAIKRNGIFRFQALQNTPISRNCQDHWLIIQISDFLKVMWEINTFLHLFTHTYTLGLNSELRFYNVNTKLPEGVLKAVLPPINSCSHCSQSHGRQCPMSPPLLASPFPLCIVYQGRWCHFNANRNLQCGV